MSVTKIHLRGLVPILIVACIALLYFNGLSEGFQASGSTSTLLTLAPPRGTTTYSIYLVRSAANIITPVKMTMTSGPTTSAIVITPNPLKTQWSTLSGFTITKQAAVNNIIIMIPAPISTKLSDYDVYTWRPGWTISTSSTATDYSVGGLTPPPPLRKKGAANILNTQIALPLPSTAPKARALSSISSIVFANLQFQQTTAALTGDASNLSATIRIDLNFVN